MKCPQLPVRIAAVSDRHIADKYSPSKQEGKLSCCRSHSVPAGVVLTNNLLFSSEILSE